MATNREVKEAFAKGRVLKAANLLSTGTSLYSYGWWEIARWVDGQVITRNGRSYSNTTATKHRSGVWGEQAVAETPVNQGPMNL